jgi:hypothetical protein
MQPRTRPKEGAALLLLLVGSLVYIGVMIAFSQGDKPLRALAVAMFGGVMIAMSGFAGDLNRGIFGEGGARFTRTAFAAFGVFGVVGGLVVCAGSLLGVG